MWRACIYCRYLQIDRCPKPVDGGMMWNDVDWNVGARLLDGNSKHFAGRKSVAAVWLWIHHAAGWYSSAAVAPEIPHSDSFGAAQPCCHLRSGRTDRDVVVQEEIENKKEYLESVKASNSQIWTRWNGPWLEDIDESVWVSAPSYVRHWPPLPLAFPSQQALFEAIARASFQSFHIRNIQKSLMTYIDILCLIAVIADVFFFAALLTEKTGPPVTPVTISDFNLAGCELSWGHFARNVGAILREWDDHGFLHCTVTWQKAFAVRFSWTCIHYIHVIILHIIMMGLLGPNGKIFQENQCPRCCDSFRSPWLWRFCCSPTHGICEVWAGSESHSRHFKNTTLTLQVS